MMPINDLVCPPTPRTMIMASPETKEEDQESLSLSLFSSSVLLDPLSSILSLLLLLLLLKRNVSLKMDFLCVCVFFPVQKKRVQGFFVFFVFFFSSSSSSSSSSPFSLSSSRKEKRTSLSLSLSLSLSVSFVCVCV